MARLIVIADTARSPDIDAPVLMDEEVKPEHLSDEHASHQIIERVAWAVLDAQEVSAGTDTRRWTRPGAHSPTSREKRPGPR